jgi:hypothetical protein
LGHRTLDEEADAASTSSTIASPEVLAAAAADLNPMGGASGSLVVGGRSAQASNSPSPSFTGNANLSLGTPRSLALNITALVRHAIRFLNLSHSVLTTSGVFTRASSAGPTGQPGQGLDEHACPQSTHNDTSRQVYGAPNLTCSPAGSSSSQGTMILAMTHSRAAFHQILSLLFLLFCNLVGGLVEGDRNVESPQARRESGTYGTNESQVDSFGRRESYP